MSLGAGVRSLPVTVGARLRDSPSLERIRADGCESGIARTCALLAQSPNGGCKPYPFDVLHILIAVATVHQHLKKSAADSSVNVSIRGI